MGANFNAPGLSGPFTYDWIAIDTDTNTTVASAPTDTTGSFTFTPPQIGNYKIALTVLDANKNTLATASTTFMVVTQAPVATITGTPPAFSWELP